MDRRTFGKLFLGAGASTCLGLSSTPARATDPITVMQGAQFVMQLLGSFMGGAGSGMEAMMSSQLQVNAVLLNQLERIETELTKLKLDFARLDDKIGRLLMDQSTIDRVSNLMSVVHEYRDYLATSRVNPAIWNSPKVAQELSKYRARVQEQSGILSESPAGWGPEQVLLIPLLVSLEISILLRYEGDRQIISVALKRYLRWLENIQSDKTRSIRSEMQLAAKEHDKAISEAAATRYGADMGIAEFAIGKKQTGLSTYEYCILLSRLGPPESRGFVDQPAKRMRQYGTRTAFMAQLVSVKLVDAPLGARHIAMERGVAQYAGTRQGGNPWVIDGFALEQATCVEWTKNDPWPLPASNDASFVDTLRDYIQRRLKENPALGTEVEQSNAMALAKIQLANAYRSRIAYCFQAQGLASLAQRRIQATLEQYQLGRANEAIGS